MSSVNKAIIIGNLGQDPQTRYMPDGNAVANISVATSETWKDKATGEKKEKTEWHRVTFYGKLAEIAAQYLAKGSKVYVEGKLQTRKWQDKDGIDRYTTEIVAHEMRMLSPKGEGPTPEQREARAAASAPAAARAPAAPGSYGKSGGFGDMDDDIPF